MTEDEGNLYIRYDGNGEVIGLRRGGQEYTYVKNLQGDITGILDPDGEQVVSYTYDAWGNHRIYDKTGVERIGHVALYLGDNYILHTASDYAVIEQMSATRRNYFVTARRFF